MPSQAMQDMIEAFRDQQKANARQVPPPLDQRRAAFAPAGTVHPIPDDVPAPARHPRGSPGHRADRDLPAGPVR